MLLLCLLSSISSSDFRLVRSSLTVTVTVTVTVTIAITVTVYRYCTGIGCEKKRVAIIDGIVQETLLVIGCYLSAKHTTTVV